MNNIQFLNKSLARPIGGIGPS